MPIWISLCSDPKGKEGTTRQQKVSFPSCWAGASQPSHVQGRDRLFCAQLHHMVPLSAFTPSHAHFSMVAMVIEYCIGQGAPSVRHGVKYANANPNFTNEGSRFHRRAAKRHRIQEGASADGCFREGWLDFLLLRAPDAHPILPCLIFGTKSSECLQ